MAFLLQFLFYPEGNGPAAGILTLSLVTLSLDLSLFKGQKRDTLIIYRCLLIFDGSSQSPSPIQYKVLAIYSNPTSFKLSSHLGLLYQPFKLVNGAAYSLGASFFK